MKSKYYFILTLFFQLLGQCLYTFSFENWRNNVCGKACPSPPPWVRPCTTLAHYKVTDCPKYCFCYLKRIFPKNIETSYRTCLERLEVPKTSKNPFLMFCL